MRNKDTSLGLLEVFKTLIPILGMSKAVALLQGLRRRFNDGDPKKTCFSSFSICLLGAKSGLQLSACFYD